jgi:hypothetical protein
MTMYDAVGSNSVLTQGDVLDECPVYTLVPADDSRGELLPRVFNLRVIVLTQACDLAQTKSNRVVVAPVYPAERYVHEGLLKPTQIRDSIRTHKTFGLYFLPEAPPPIAFPESIVDLRDLHTVPRVTLEELAAKGQRVTRLVTPYREHLARRFAVTYMRVALPEPFATRP